MVSEIVRMEPVDLMLPALSLLTRPPTVHQRWPQQLTTRRPRALPRQELRLCPLVARHVLIRCWLSIRVWDAQPPIRHVVATTSTFITVFETALLLSAAVIRMLSQPSLPLRARIAPRRRQLLRPSSDFNSDGF
jgi:hypothetical protein